MSSEPKHKRRKHKKSSPALKFVSRFRVAQADAASLSPEKDLTAASTGPAKFFHWKYDDADTSLQDDGTAPPVYGRRTPLSKYESAAALSAAKPVSPSHAKQLGHGGHWLQPDEDATMRHRQMKAAQSQHQHQQRQQQQQDMHFRSQQMLFAQQQQFNNNYTNGLMPMISPVYPPSIQSVQLPPTYNSEPAMMMMMMNGDKNSSGNGNGGNGGYGTGNTELFAYQFGQQGTSHLPPPHLPSQATPTPKQTSALDPLLLAVAEDDAMDVDEPSPQPPALTPAATPSLRPSLALQQVVLPNTENTSAKLDLFYSTATQIQQAPSSAERSVMIGHNQNSAFKPPAVLRAANQIGVLTGV